MLNKISNGDKPKRTFVEKKLIGKNNAFDYWNTLEKKFNDDSQARLMQLHWQLKSLRKGVVSIEKYIIHWKDIIDHILVAREILTNIEYVLYVLGKLGRVYESLMIIVIVHNKK